MEKPKAIVDRNRCLACGGCISLCPQDAITMYSSKAVISKKDCISCALCVKTCPIGAVSWEDK